MKLIIDIPEATYEMIKEMRKRNGTEYMNELESGVANGTPLPKGEWVRNIHDKTICSRCGAEKEQGYDEYCSHCGADMRKEQE